MKTTNIENVVVDEANHVTYVVMAPRLLTDGELYSAIRVALLRRKSRVTKGETFVINTAR
jgi:hypothetical protein